MRTKQVGLILFCSVILANAYDPDQLLRRAVSLTGGLAGPNRSTFSSRRTSELDGNAEVSASGKIGLTSGGQGTNDEQNLTATEHAPGPIPKWLDAAPTEMFAVFSKHVTEDEADAQGLSKPKKSSGGMPWKTILFALIVTGLLFFFGPAIYAALFAPKALPGRLNEVSRESADQNVWASSKARQTYRKSVLAAQSAKDTSESEASEGGPPNSSPSLKVPGGNKRSGVSMAAAARRSSAAPSAAAADVTAEESGSDVQPIRPRSPSIRSSNTVGTTGTGGGSYKNRRRAPPSAS